MRFVLCVASTVISFVAFAGLAGANNNFTSPNGGTVITGTSGFQLGATGGANGQTGEPGAFTAGTALNTIWYAWTAPASGTVTFETCNATQTTHDTVIAAYTGTAVNALTQIIQNDDTTGCATSVGANLGSRITFPVVAGTRYHIQVDGYDNFTGAFRLAWSLAAFNISKAQIGAPNPVTAAGQTITYNITVANVGAVAMTAPVITDTLQLGGVARTLTSGPILASGDAAPLGTLNVGETWVYTATYTVPLADMNGSGSYTNQASFDTAQTNAFSSGVVTTNVTRTPALTIDKNFTITTDQFANGTADAGDVITYTYTVTNSGNVTITGVSVSDIHNAAGTLGTITPASVATLAPGANAVFQATYTVLQQDLDNQ
jgi:uncharacterized repeat protein (TIGR01451 family)